MTEAPAVLFSGANGSGKTNCLEALSFLTSGRGLRHARLDEIFPLNPSDGDASVTGWGVQAVVCHHDERVRLATGVSERTRSKRQVMINGAENHSTAALDDYVRMLWYLPQMARLFQDGRQARLKLLDRAAARFDKSHIGRLSGYDRQMRERLAVLTQTGQDRWLDSLEHDMALRAVAITAARKQMAQRLNRMTQDPPVPELPKITLQLIGMEDDKVLLEQAIVSEQSYQQQLKRHRSRDRSQARSHYGIHLYDVRIRCERKGVLPVDAKYGSTGEQKIILLSLILAELNLMLGEAGPKPILLLDDVAAHLDTTHLQMLLGYLHSLDVQLFFTGTDGSFLHDWGDKALHYRLE